VKAVAFCIAFFCFGCAAVEERTPAPKVLPASAQKSISKRRHQQSPAPKQNIRTKTVSDSDTVKIATIAIINGDFEEGLRGWRVEGPHRAEVVSAPGFPEEHCLHINITAGHACGRNIAKHPEKWLKVYQQVVVPPDAAYLTFWVRIYGRFWHEPLRIFVQKKNEHPRIVWNWGGGGSVSRERIPWTIHVVDIRSLSRQKVVIGFVGANWNGFSDHITDIWIDNVAFLDENFLRTDEHGKRDPQELKDKTLRLFQQLESDDWLIRDRATKELEKLVRSSLVALLTARQHTTRLGPEGQARLERILARQRKGIRVVFSQIKK